MNNFFSTLFASVTVSALLSAALIWLGKAWISQRIQNSIRHEYDLKLETHKALLAAEQSRNLEKIKAELATAGAEKNARRDYEYEAKKRLYEQYEPLLFQLIEQSEDAYYRVVSLMRSVRDGKLNPEGGWLDHRGYYMRSTIYKLLAPMAIFKIIQRKLTFVDFSVDESVTTTYTLAKILSHTFSSDFELARKAPEIPYEPFLADGSPKSDRHGIGRRQGISLGSLDNVLYDCFLSGREPYVLCTFGEFERNVDQLLQNKQDHDISLVFKLFDNFHPSTCSVLWRILLTQAHIHSLLFNRIGIRSNTPASDILSNTSLSPEENSELQWDPLSATADSAIAVEFIHKYIHRFHQPI